ncbi:hypothetical protein PQ478_09415 [Alkalihalophilus pseudofirmus]|uniref:hypothetical protein n=1 Tax=Alkalihalophilus pseudofirmus TaxID=79885 RepID=UPI00259BB392|nr:hypothetical protein [Alkalihalophilus pseudofirmus]WEG18686.1 hypothetical protein PQ478_09415 [Alkalihalophilus pseudofirmus]
MAQVRFDKDEFHGELQFYVETSFDGGYQTELSFSEFDDLSYYLRAYYFNNYKELFQDSDIVSLVLTGISFKGRKYGESESFSLHLDEGWKRAIVNFDEKKYGDLNVDKLKRIRDIIIE